MAKAPGPLRRLWYGWKNLQLPWRRKWLAGYDLQGNTFWEFKDALHSQRNRRIVKYSRWTHHGDVNVPPQWMQWLRHTRFEAPTIEEQQADVYRQNRIKVLAAEADARWASKPSALDAPDKQQPVQMLQSRDPSTGVRQMNAAQESRERAEPPRATEEVEKDVEGPDVTTWKMRKTRKEPKDSPWKQAAQGNPSDEWQPESWSPTPAKRRA